MLRPLVWKPLQTTLARLPGTKPANVLLIKHTPDLRACAKADAHAVLLGDPPEGLGLGRWVAQGAWGLFVEASGPPPASPPAAVE